MNAVLVPAKDAFAVVGDVHGHNNDGALVRVSEQPANPAMSDHVPCRLEDLLDQRPRWTIPGRQLTTTRRTLLGLQTQHPNGPQLRVQFGCTLMRPGSSLPPFSPGMRPRYRTDVAPLNHPRLMPQNPILRQVLTFQITSLETRLMMILCLMPSFPMSHRLEVYLTRRIPGLLLILQTTTGAPRGPPHPPPRLVPKKLNPLTSGRRLARRKRSLVARWYDFCTNVHYSSFLSQVQPPELLDSLLRHCQQVSQEMWPTSEVSNGDNWRSGFDDHADAYVLNYRCLGGLHLVMHVLF